MVMIKKTAPTIRCYHRGKILFHEGQDSRVAFMIKSGSVDIYKMRENTRTVLASLGKGDIFGEMAILAKEKRSANAVATSFCELFIITEDLMTGLLDSSPSTVRKMVKLLAQRVTRADRNSFQQDTGSPFLALAKILDLAYKDYLYTPPQEKRDNRDYDLGLSVETFSNTVRSLAVYSRLEIDLCLESLSKLKLVEVVSKIPRDSFAERFIKIAEPELFMDSVTNLYQEMKEVGGALECRMTFHSIPEVTKGFGCSPDTFLKKIIKEEVPENLFFFNLKKALEWSKDKDDKFFRKVYRSARDFKEMDSLDDLIFIDNHTLKKILEGLSYQKIIMLYQASDSFIKNKISQNVGRKLADILTEEEQSVQSDQVKLHEIIDEFFRRLRKIKKI